MIACEPANMSERNAECDDWMSKPNVCRFCISTTGSFDLTALYMSADGGREVLLYMLEDCYSINLSNISEWGPSRVVCDSCATRLRHAYCFKLQVLQAEERFKEYLSKNGDLKDVKIEEHRSIEIEENQDIVERLGIKELKCEVDNENIDIVENTVLGDVYNEDGHEEMNINNINQPDSTVTKKESEQKKRGIYHPRKRKKKPKRKCLTHVKKRTKVPTTKQVLSYVKDLTNVMFKEDNENINIVENYNAQYSMKELESKSTLLKMDTASKMNIKTTPATKKGPKVSRKRMNSVNSANNAEEDIEDFDNREDREGMDTADNLNPQDSKVYEMESGVKTDKHFNPNKRKRKRNNKFTHVKQRPQAVINKTTKSNNQDRKGVSPTKRVQNIAKKIYDKVKDFSYDRNEAGPGNTEKRVNNKSKGNAKTSDPKNSTTKLEPEYNEIKIINASNTDIETKRPVIKKNIIINLSRKRMTSTSSAEDAEAINVLKDANDNNNQNMDKVKDCNTENLTNQKQNKAKSVKCESKKRTVRKNEDKIVKPKRIRKAMIITYSDDSDCESESNMPTLIANTLKEQEIEFSSETIERVRKTMQRNVTCDTVLNYTTACPFRKEFGKLRCLYCPNVFCDISELRKHTPTHVSIDLTKIIQKITILNVDITDLLCTICNTALNDSDDMIKHFIDAHSKFIYSECLRVHVLSNETNKQSEMRKSGDEIDGDKCLDPVGPKKAKQRPETRHSVMTCETILKHTTSCPFKEHLSMFHCFFCNKSFTEFAPLKQHVKQNHTPEDINEIKNYPSKLQIDICDFQCKICNIDLTDIDNMVQHFSDAHNKIVYKKCIAGYKLNEPPYLCHICNEARFDEFKHLNTHLDEHSANGLCDVCGDLFLNPKRLGDHKRRTHAKDTNPCTGKSEGVEDKRKIIKVKKSKCIDAEGVRKILMKAKWAKCKSAAVPSIVSKSVGADVVREITKNQNGHM